VVVIAVVMVVVVEMMMMMMIVVVVVMVVVVVVVVLVVVLVVVVVVVAVVVMVVAVVMANAELVIAWERLDTLVTKRRKRSQLNLNVDQEHAYLWGGCVALLARGFKVEHGEVVDGLCMHDWVIRICSGATTMSGTTTH
jgi:hypothetical protein